jgi:hypothetical protein
MPPTSGPAVADGLAARLRRLEAERLAPVPRARHAVAVDAADLALLVGHVQGLIAQPGSAPLPADVRMALARLNGAVRGHVAPGAAPG